MADPNKAWTAQEKKDFEKGATQGQSVAQAWQNLKEGLGFAEPSPVAKKLYTRENNQIPVRGVK